MPFFRRRIHTAAALSALLIGAAAAAQTPPAASGGAAPAMQTYAQPAGPLVETLNSIARRGGLVLVMDAQALKDLTAQAVHGRYTPVQALQRALEGSGWQLVHDHGEFYSLRPAPKSRSNVATLAPVHVTAQAEPRMEVYQTPGSVNVVTREDIDRLPPRNAGDLLSDIPGVATSQSRQNPGLAVNIRGLQGYGRVNVMIDGARQNFQQSGHGSNGSVYLDPALLAQVDVAKGPSSSVGGAGMIAGSVNFRTLDVDDVVKPGNTHGAQLNLTTGSNRYRFAGSLAAGWKLDEHWSMVAAASKKKIGEFDRGERNVGGPVPALSGAGASRLTSQDMRSGLFKLNWKPSADHQFKLGYVGYTADFNEGDTTGVGSSIESVNKVRSDTVTLSHRWTPDSPWWQLDTSVYYANTRNDSNREALDALDLAPSQMHYETYTVGATTENRAMFHLGQVDAQWTLGGEFYRDRTRPGAVAQTLGVNRQDPEVLVGGTPQGERTVVSAFTELALSWQDRVELAGGLRYDRYGLRGDGLIYVGRFFNGPGARPPYSDLYTSFSTDKHDSAVLPSIRLAVKPLEALQLFASYGKGMRPPAITETLRFGQHPGIVFPYYPNPNLEAEKSRNWEVGANLMLDGLATADDKLGLKLAWFDTKVDNYIVGAAIMTPTSTTSGGFTPPTAHINLLAPFRSRGLELSADYDAGVAFASVNYTHSLIDTGEARYDPFPLGSTVGYPPTSYGQGGSSPDIMYAMPPQKKLVIGGGVRLFDRRLALGVRMHYEKPSQQNTLFVGNASSTRSYRLYDVWASLAVTENITLRLAVQNLRDENYHEIQDGSYWIGPGRTTMATLSIRY